MQALRELIGVCTSGARRDEYLNFPGMDKEAIDDWDFSRCARYSSWNYIRIIIG